MRRYSPKTTEHESDRKQRGMTLLELIIACAILMILATAAHARSALYRKAAERS